jgi:hypothetical protein
LNWLRDIIGTSRNEDKSLLLTSKGYRVHKYDPANGYKLRQGIPVTGPDAGVLDASLRAGCYDDICDVS